MEISDYYYKILDLDNNATKEEINKAYNSKIQKYIGLPFLNHTQETEVKELIVIPKNSVAKIFLIFSKKFCV